MDLPVDEDKATVTERSGSAGRALECDGVPYDGGGAAYDSGLASVQDDATEALEIFIQESAFAVTLPAEGYRVERKDAGRVLLSYDVDERTKIAVVAADDVVDYNGDGGWGVESWAKCDPAELPASVTEALDIQGGRTPPETGSR